MAHGDARARTSAADVGDQVAALTDSRHAPAMFVHRLAVSKRHLRSRSPEGVAEGTSRVPSALDLVVAIEPHASRLPGRIRERQASTRTTKRSSMFAWATLPRQSCVRDATFRRTTSARSNSTKDIAGGFSAISANCLSTRKRLMSTPVRSAAGLSSSSTESARKCGRASGMIAARANTTSCELSI